MKSSCKAKRSWLWVVLIIVLALSVVLFLDPARSPISYEHQDIDLNTGRARYTWVVHQAEKVEIKHTPISVALELVDLDSLEGDWRRVNTFAPGARHSPHYIYHGALGQANNLGLVWQIQDYSKEARKEVAATVLELWRQAGRDSGADDYIGRLMDLQHDQVTLSDIIPLREK